MSLAPADLSDRGPRTIPLIDRSLAFEAMGGRVTLRASCRAEEVEAADRVLRQVAGRVHAWAQRLTRFDQRSELSALNRWADERPVLVRPTLGTMLGQAVQAGERTEGLVDISMLDARLDAEAGSPNERLPASWSVRRRGRRYVVERQRGARFDLDGVAKGWIADRALAMLSGYAAAMVDADGDVAIRMPPGSGWQVAIADPLRRGSDLAILTVPSTHSGTSLGICTSGTTVHGWESGIGWAHHLIDPRTGRSAVTDVVQATVIAESALAAESLAKAVVIEGADDGLELLERAGAWAAFVLLRNGQLLALERSMEWLA